MKSILALFLMAGIATAQEKKPLKVGDKAPDFTLKNHKDKDVKLSKAFKDRWVVLAFYPKANTLG